MSLSPSGLKDWPCRGANAMFNLSRLKPFPLEWCGSSERNQKLTVWCALWAGGIIGPYFFKNDEGHNVTVNGDRYRAMITNFFSPELNNHDVQEL
ncbi:hypothetical protein TNCV_3314831 [Trichonephila clavipes]|nr:hypothetical protein TNCV_3314831 [Trichonephila clavipes]